MYRITNYHTHCTFCDGKNTVEENINKAKALGLSALGFSSHMALPFALDCHVAMQNAASYFDTIRVLKEKESATIEILAGVEAEYISGITSPDKALYKQFKPDYIIGAVHYIVCDVQKKHPLPYLFSVDAKTEAVQQGLDRLFHGDGKKAVQTYFALQRDMIQNCDFNIIAHPDVIRKRNGVLHFFDETDGWYRRELKATARVIAQSGKVTEINTGGMTRAGMTNPYPSADFLQLLRAYDAPVMLNSDSHQAQHLCAHFEDGLSAALAAGYRELWYLSGSTWHSQKIPA